MSRGRARGRHCLNPTNPGRRRLAWLTAATVTALAVGVGVSAAGSGALVSNAVSANAGSPNVLSADLAAAGATPATPDIGPRTVPPAPRISPRALGTSRSAQRVPLVSHRVPKAHGRLWTTAALRLRIEPRARAGFAGLLSSGRQVQVTGRHRGAYAEVVAAGVTRWVSADYLSKSRAAARQAVAKRTVAKRTVVDGSSNGGSVSGQPCPDGSSIEAGLQPAAIRTYRAVCNAFPELSAYGGQDGHGEHVNGQAIDFMVTSSSVGQRVADYLYAHQSEFDLFDIIWSQHIWTIERAGEGFRSMSDRGSATANHYDHVHIKVN